MVYNEYASKSETLDYEEIGSINLNDNEINYVNKFVNKVRFNSLISLVVLSTVSSKFLPSLVRTIFSSDSLYENAVSYFILCFIGLLLAGNFLKLVLDLICVRTGNIKRSGYYTFTGVPKFQFRLGNRRTSSLFNTKGNSLFGISKVFVKDSIHNKNLSKCYTFRQDLFDLSLGHDYLVVSFTGNKFYLIPLESEEMTTNYGFDEPIADDSEDNLDDLIKNVYSHSNPNPSSVVVTNSVNPIVSILLSLAVIIVFVAILLVLFKTGAFEDVMSVIITVVLMLFVSGICLLFIVQAFKEILSKREVK